jgi:uncharacterized protein with von Willebrand factor type A (vWA) domain
MNPLGPGSVTTHLVAFCRFLRSHGFTIGPKEELEMFSAIAQVGLHRVELFQLTLSQLLCKSRIQQLDFPRLFDEFWQQLFRSLDAKIKQSNKRGEKKDPAPSNSLVQLKNWLYRQKSSQTEELAFYGSEKQNNPEHLSHIQKENIQDFIRVIEEIAKKWASTPSRRKVKSRRAGQIDLRQLMRKNLTKGELLDIGFRDNKIQKPRLVLVCDVSKSMEMFTDFTIKLLYAFQNSYRSIDTFVFGTELYHVSKLLKLYSFRHSLEMLSSEVTDWSGGTRIGHSLDTLIRDYGKRLLRDKVIFIIISDGWDTGDQKLLESSMVYIKRRVNKLIWLNPQAGRPGYQPEVQGMITAIPFIDYLHGVHDLNSLKNLKSKI